MKRRNSEMYINDDCLVRMIYGLTDIVAGLYDSGFQNRLMDALSDKGTAKQDFLESDHHILVGSIGVLSAGLEIISTGLLNGDIDISITDD